MVTPIESTALAHFELSSSSFSAHFLLFFGSRAAQLTLSNAGFKLIPQREHPSPAEFASHGY
jgi:hypothetical protein